jgi:hypothetical protein
MVTGSRIEIGEMAGSMASVPYEFAFNPSFSASLHRVGLEQQPVLVLEGLLRNATTVIDYAAREVTFAPASGEHGGYPGLRAPAPLNYVNALVRTVSPAIEKAFGLVDVRLSRAQCNLCLVTLPPDRLAPLQRIPHIDTVDPLQFALLHYLCDPSHGGTAFYRHRQTGFETVTLERAPIYEAARERELTAAGIGYITGDTEHYEQTACFDARFDRLLVYRSQHLHSGQIGSPDKLNDDPRHGRLTANIFVNYRSVAAESAGFDR